MSPADPLLPVFVYGTLRPERANWHVIEPRVDHHRPGRLAGHRLVHLEYPVAVPAADDDGPTAVVGDVLWLEPDGYRDTLAALDRFEDHRVDDPDGSLYVRVRRPVRLSTTSSSVASVAAPLVEAWVYLAGVQHAARLAPGDELRSGEY
jgi:gamma-glutamylcyclotransferase (GGCT)/AIG2-like uncharacterized protein YtfP